MATTRRAAAPLPGSSDSLATLTSAGLRINVFVGEIQTQSPKVMGALEDASARGYVVTDQHGNLCGRLVPIDSLGHA
jgi:hypothetical protein